MAAPSPSASTVSSGEEGLADDRSSPEASAKPALMPDDDRVEEAPGFGVGGKLPLAMCDIRTGASPPPANGEALR